MDDDRPFHPFEEEEAGAEFSLRPTSFDEFIGQTRVKENLLIAIETARERADVLDHVLLSGMPGLGKTTLARLIASVSGGGFHTLLGPNLTHGKDVMGPLTTLKPGDVLFIDEIHRMSGEAEEYLYSAMEDSQVDIVLDKGIEARSVRLQIAPFTLVGATTREGLLSAPFRSRFGIQEKLEPYADEDLARIICRSARLLGATIGFDVAVALARRSRGTPRYANRFLRRVRDVAQYRARFDSPLASRVATIPGRRLGEADLMPIDPEAVEEGLERLGVDALGLDRTDRRILEILIGSGERPVGLKTIAVSVGEEERTIEDVYEPYLIQRGMLVKTPRGRLATARAMETLSCEGSRW